MTTLRRKGAKLHAIPSQDGFTEASTGGNNRDRLALTLYTMTGIEDMQFMRLELQDAVGCGLEVIEQFNVRGANGMGQRQLLQRPGKMYRPALAIEHGSSHAKATGPQ